METIHNDKFIKFEYDPQTNKYRFPVNAVGAHDYYDIEEADFTPADATCIFVNASTGNDSTGDGTSANPYATTAKGINETDETHVYVIRQDSIVSAEDISGCTFDYFTGLFAASGATPKLSLRVLDFTPSDSNSIFVSKTGNDSTGDGTQATPYLTINEALTHCDATHQKVGILDSGTYEEEGFEFTGNFKGIFAVEGEKPELVITPKLNDDYYECGTAIYNRVAPSSGVRGSFCILPNGNNVIVYRTGSSTNTRYKFVITDYNNNIIKGETTVLDAECTNGWAEAVTLPTSGGFLITVVSNYVFYVYQYDSSGNYVRNYTVGGSYNYCGGRIIALDTNDDDDRFALLFTGNDAGTDQYLRYAIYKGSDGSTIKSPTSLGMSIRGSYGREHMFLLPLSVGGNKGHFVFSAYSYNLGGAPGSFCVTRIYDKSGNVIATSSATAEFYNMFELSDGKLIACTNLSSNADFKYSLLDTDLTVYQAEASLFTYGASGGRRHFSGKYISETDNIILSYCIDGDAFYCVIHNDYSIIKPEQQFSSGYSSILYVDVYNDYFYAFDHDAFSTNTLKKIGYFTYRGILVNSDWSINGIILTTNHDRISSMLYGTGTGEIYFSTVKNLYYDSSIDYIAGLIESGSISKIYNSAFESVSGGIIYESTNTEIKNSQFIRINKGYAIDIDGEAASSGDITIEHCDIFDCYGGIRLQNNGGTNEIVKNCIIHDIDNYAVNAETEITCDNSVVTGSVNNVNISGSSSYIKANPLYANEGGINPNDTDLNIKVKILGDVANSPAYGLADDSRNAGAIDVKYVGSITTWSSIRIIKPMAPDTGIVPINPVSSVKRAASYKDGDARIISLKWASEALTADELDDLTAMVCCLQTNGLYAYLVRLYPDPDTFPDSYYLYAIDFTKSSISESAGHYAQTEDGVLGNELVLMRRFEA